MHYCNRTGRFNRLLCQFAPFMYSTSQKHVYWRWCNTFGKGPDICRNIPRSYTKPSESLAVVDYKLKHDCLKAGSVYISPMMYHRCNRCPLCLVLRVWHMEPRWYHICPHGWSCRFARHVYSWINKQSEIYTNLKPVVTFPEAHANSEFPFSVKHLHLWLIPVGCYVPRSSYHHRRKTQHSS